MTKLAGDHVQVLVNGYDLTGDHNQITIADARDMYDVTTFGDAVHKFLAGKRSVSFEHAGYLNASAARSHPVLRNNNVDGVVSMFWVKTQIQQLAIPSTAWWFGRVSTV